MAFRRLGPVTVHPTHSGVGPRTDINTSALHIALVSVWDVNRCERANVRTLGVLRYVLDVTGYVRI